MQDSGPFSLSGVVAAAKLELPELETKIRALVKSAHPLELLANLALHLSDPSNEHPDVEEHARWQVRIELVAWIILSTPFPTAEEEDFVSGDILQPLEEALDEYFAAFALSLMPEVTGDAVADAEHRIRSRLQTEALYVRGEGLPSQVKKLAIGMYGPHDEWFRANLGFTIAEAFHFTEIVFGLLSARLQDRRVTASDTRERALRRYRRLFKKRPKDRTEFEQVVLKAVTEKGPEHAARQETYFTFSYRLRDVMSFAVDDLTDFIGEGALPESFQRFLDRMSCEIGSVISAPNPLGFNPLGEFPFIRHEGRYLLPAPPDMYEALLSSFHFNLWRDEAYRDTYDKARSEWLEREALEALRPLLAGAEIGWSLKYGPKANRAEVDGLVLWDNKLILIEAKWKNLTQVARQGSSEAMQIDVRKSIEAAYLQAARARDFIRNQSEVAVFTAHDGRELLVYPAKVSEIYLVSLLGRGAMAVLASKLPMLRPLGLFGASEYPWALSLIDLRLVCELMEYPSQLFDYIKRRDEVVRDLRFLGHDEWDLVGLYLSGHLDTRHHEFEGYDGVVFAGADADIDRFLRSTESASLPIMERPRRELPENIRQTITAIEASDQPGKSDFAVAILNLPDYMIEILSQQMDNLWDQTSRDHKTHTVSFLPPNVSTGVVLVYTYGDPELMTSKLVALCKAKKYVERNDLWLGIGIDVQTPLPPHAIAFVDGEWREDKEFEKYLPMILKNPGARNALEDS